MPPLSSCDALEAKIQPGAFFLATCVKPPGHGTRPSWWASIGQRRGRSSEGEGLERERGERHQPPWAHWDGRGGGHRSGGLGPGTKRGGLAFAGPASSRRSARSRPRTPPRWSTPTGALCRPASAIPTPTSTRPSRWSTPSTATRFASLRPSTTRATRSTTATPSAGALSPTSWGCSRSATTRTACVRSSAPASAARATWQSPTAPASSKRTTPGARSRSKWSRGSSRSTPAGWTSRTS